MPQLTINLFGPPEVIVDGEIIKIGRRKALGILIYAAATGRPHSRDTLAAMFWPEAEPGRARAALRSALWTLNATPVALWLDVDSETVRFKRESGSDDGSVGTPAPVLLDTARFIGLLKQVAEHGHPQGDVCDACLATLSEAVAIPRDTFLTGFTLPDTPSFDEWQFYEAARLRDELAASLERLVAGLVVRGAYETAIPYARRLVALDPLHEPAHRQLMSVYAGAGQHSAALRQFETCRDVLDSELGVRPAAETRALHDQIRRERAQGATNRPIQRDSSHTPLGPSDSETTSNLPHGTPPLVGREKELARLDSLLREIETRLVTIVGPGGIGKTRLAVAAADRCLADGRYPDGVQFVALTPLADVVSIVPAVADAVGFPLRKESRTVRQQLTDYLRHKRMLLVLDNMEHLLSGGANDASAFVGDLLAQSDKLDVLVTSRERLNLYEEQRFPLGGLEVRGDGDYAAASLFMQRARRHQPDYELTPGDMTALAEICRLVEGMPLALELAASWLDVLSVAEIAAQIQHGLDTLVNTARNVPERHRSMQAVFDTSWQALGTKDQATFAALSVFRGGFTGQAAQSVAGASLTMLKRFVDKSLMRFDPSRRRYDLHELLRKYAAEKLGQAASEVRNQHAAYFSALLARLEPDLKGAGQREALTAIASELDNIRDAWLWAAEAGNINQLEQAVASLALFFQWRRRFDQGEALLRVAVERLSSESLMTLDSVDTPDRLAKAATLLHLLTWHGLFLLATENYNAAAKALRSAETLESALEQAGWAVPAPVLALLRLELSDLVIVEDFAASESLVGEALKRYRVSGDAWGEAQALDALSQRYMNQGRQQEAVELLEEALAIRQRLEDKRGIARTYNTLGLVVLHIGEIERSERYLRESLALYRTWGNRADLSNPLAVLGLNLLFGGKFEACLATYDECRTLHQTLALPQEPFLADITTMRARVDLGDYAEARRQSDESLARYRALNDPWKVAFTLHNLGRLDLVKGQIIRALDRFKESADILVQMNERALLPEVLCSQGYALRLLGQAAAARDVLQEGLQMIVDTGPLNPMRFELPLMALLLADEGEIEQAVELHFAAQQSVYIRRSRWFRDVAGQRLDELAAMHPPVRVAAARERGQRWDLWELINALLRERGEERDRTANPNGEVHS